MANGTSISDSSKKELFALLNNTRVLFGQADTVRKKYCGDEVYIRGIIEFSNYCIRNCRYCGLRRDNRCIVRYRMTTERIAGLARKIYQEGVRTVVLQSGDDPGFTRTILCEIISKIKEENPGIAVTLSIGERPLEDYSAFRNAGADRYLLKHETANPALYDKLHPGQNLKQRIGILEYCKKLGYETGSGMIVGLPGQQLQDLVDDVLLLRSLDVDMIGIGPFIPRKDTPLSYYPSGDVWLTLKMLALSRVITENTNIPATTALATVNPHYGHLLGLRAGCNVIMPDFTPERFRRKYVIYDNKIRVTLERATAAIADAGRIVSFARGDSPNKANTELPLPGVA
jgi:biotin synthase